MIALVLALAAAQETPVDADVAARIAAMTPAEKAAQLQSKVTQSSPDLPAYDYWNEALHGLARNGVATVFPQAIGLAATWDAPLMERIGTAVSTEARAKYNALSGDDRKRYQGLTIWSPNINIFRDPRWGRGQETYGEDPVLTGTLAVGYVRGLQGPDPEQPRVIATPKHLAAHSGPEAGRDSFSVQTSPHDVEATYLPAFRQALTEGKAQSVMCAYNGIHGVPACAAGWLLNDRVRRDWGFTGFVVSDCDAIGNIAHYQRYARNNAEGSALAIAAGMDLNCGTGFAALDKALADGLTDQATVDRALGRVLMGRKRLGDAFGTTSRWDSIRPDQVGTPQHRALALEAARKSIVLLENRGVLPLKAGARIAVIGPNADSVDVLQANYHGTAARPVTPLAGLNARFDVRYAQGATLADGVPVVVPATAFGDGLTAEFFADPDLAGTPMGTAKHRTVDFDWNRAPPLPSLPDNRYGVRWTGTLAAEGPGEHVLRVDIPRCWDACTGRDAVRLWIDDQPVIADSGDGKGVEVRYTFADTKPHRFRMELAHRGEDEGVRLTWVAPAAAQRERAVAAAQDADAVVAFVGLSPAVEGEALQIEVPGFSGGDRTDIGLSAAQQSLLEAVKTSGKPLIVVLLSGSAVAMEWAKANADAVLAAWYPGEAGGTAIADVLDGTANPSGRLPVTFYARTRDLPAFVDYNMRERTYRYFSGTPLWGFGHGLSYSSFGYAAPSGPANLRAGETLTVTARVTNQGKRTGDEVVQAYLIAPDALNRIGSFNDPVLRHSLVGFQRITLKPGERGTVRFTLDPRRLSTVDVAGNRAVRPGEYRLFIGGGQPGMAAGSELRFTITGEQALPK
ncbi:glycoside hydrolase family 3 C-terminal domain-containing protein [Sphingomonas sp. BGYR3]|uniref:glycoside hydrolase family 3 C-terminal domain-containing protein n=1 Tax=Sphingomonas sp. BGYR3 TaxID=2975483 RepID=UPI0021A8D211|nr:glycoside hydrolase family 3 C-terminal domain-containing protein [Sphingomonas sp. BGYR3]MDG5487239.1 glycoside hydrolase family 3 C-terminal domain-containing protein [Sphingomonas sp. BGYR3]